MPINIPGPVIGSSITINYQETATNSITDLTGTKWFFNSEIDLTGSVDYKISFNCDGVNYILLGLGLLDELSYWDSSEQQNIVYQGKQAWLSEAFRTIEITGGTDATNATLISWLQANATQVVEPAITDLTGTKWLIKKPSEFIGVGFEEGYVKITSVDLVYKMYASTYESAVQNEFRIRQQFDSSTGSFAGCLFATATPIVYPRFVIFCSPSNNSSYVQFQAASDDTLNLGDIETTIEITGGTDVTNSDLISWLQANATQIEEEEPEPEPEPTPSNPNLNDIFTDVANAIRAKTGKSDPLYPVNFANEIAAIETGGGGVELNIHYSSTTAPSDTSKLWVKTDTEPEKVSVSKDLALGAETISTLDATLPTAISVMVSGVVGTKIYIFGGFASGSSSGYSNKIYRFDTTTETITTLSTTLPDALNRTTSGVVGTKIYIFGGLTTHSTNSDKIYCFDTETETISILSTRLPTILHNMTSGVVGTKIYLFGGKADESSGSVNSNKIYRFDTTTETITTLSTTLPDVIYRMASGVVGTKIYIFGGATDVSGGSNYSNKIYRFDTTTETITTLSTQLPKYMLDMVSCVVGTKIYLFGGFVGNVALNTIYCFDTVTETITTLSTTLPTVIYRMASGVVGTKIYIFGGQTDPDTYSSIIYRFTVSFALPENNLLLLDTGSTSFNLVNSNALVIEAKPKQVYIGDSNDSGEYVESALYANGAWQPIG